MNLSLVLTTYHWVMLNIKIVSSYISYLDSENHFQWNLDGSDKCNCKDRSYTWPQDGNCGHHGYRNRLNRKKRRNSSNSTRKDKTIISTMDHKLLNIPLQTLQHSPSSWIWSSIGQFSLGQSWIGSWRVQLIRPLSQLHSTQRLGLWDDPCAIGTFKLVHPANK